MNNDMEVTVTRTEKVDRDVAAVVVLKFLTWADDIENAVMCQLVSSDVHGPKPVRMNMTEIKNLIHAWGTAE